MGAIYLIRHGQASFDAEDYDNLSDLGRQQSRLLGKTLATRNLHVDTVYCGTMRRHRQTAEACLNAMNAIRPVRELSTLNEYDHQEIITRHTPRYSDYHTMRSEMAQAENPWRAFQQFFSEAVQRWMNTEHAADYNEPWQDFQQRCQGALHTIVEATRHGENILVFTSGGPIATMCQQLMGLSDHYTLEINWALVNTGITKLNRGQQRCRLSVLNEHSHLDSTPEWLTYR